MITPYEYDGAYHFYGEGRWGYRGRVLGGPNSGYRGHSGGRGGPGNPGGSRPRGGSVAGASTGILAGLKDGLDSLVGDSRVRKELAIKAQKAIEEFLELGASEHLDELVLVGSFLSPTKQPNDIDIVYVGKDAVAVGEMQRIHGTMLNSGSLDLQVNILPGRRDHRFMGWLERSTKERYGVDPLVLFARTTKLSEPNLALSLQEMGYEKSIEYLIANDYHFRTDGKRIAILGGPNSGYRGHTGGRGGPGNPGGSQPRSGGSFISERRRLAKGNATELYRWANLADVVDASIGRHETSLDMTDKKDFYFAPHSVEKESARSWVVRTYGRMIFDRDELAKAGWVKDSTLKTEGAWRWKPGAVPGKTWRDFPDDSHVTSSFIKAVRGFEVIKLPEGKTIEDVQAIMDYRLGRQVPVIQANLPDLVDW